MKDMTPDFHCPFCPQKRVTWDALMLHIGSSHPPDEDVSELVAQQEHDERVALRGEAMNEIARENEEYLVVMVLTEEWIDVLRANVN